MRTQFTLLRGALAVLLVGTACLFAIGSTIERHHHHHRESAVATAAGGETGNESAGEAAQPKPLERRSGEAGARILGVDTESVTLSVVAVVAALLLAAAVWLRPASLILLAVSGFGLVFAAGDGRELVHQLDESNGGLAAVAAVLLALHLAVALLAIALFASRRAEAGLRMRDTAR